MLETRILESETRSISVSNAEIRVGENRIYIGGSLPLRSLSTPIRDRKTGKKFKERIEPLAFKLALLSNKAHGYKTKLLKNHNYEQELEYKELEYEEIDERELRFLFTLPKTERNLELLKDISEDNASFSFGFLVGSERKQLSREQGIDYIRIIDSFKQLREISVLDKFTLGAYEKAKGFSETGSYASAEKKAEKFITKKNREALCKKHDKKLQEIKEYIYKQKRNDLFRFGAEVKIPL